jgi:hypothetical protein
MKNQKEILEYYGKCCVSEYLLATDRKYPSGEKGEILERSDNRKIENIKGQKKAIEFIFGL